MDKSRSRNIHHKAAGIGSYARLFAPADYLVVERAVLQPDIFYAMAQQAIDNAPGIIGLSCYIGGLDLVRKRIQIRAKTITISSRIDCINFVAGLIKALLDRRSESFAPGRYSKHGYLRE